MGGEHGGDITGPLQVEDWRDVDQGEAGVVQTETVEETGQDLLQLQPAGEVGGWPVGGVRVIGVSRSTTQCHNVELEKWSLFSRTLQQIYESLLFSLLSLRKIV